MASFRKVFQQSGIYAFGDLVTRGAGLLLLPLYTAFLDPADYGIVALATVIASMFGVLATLGGRGAALKFYYDFDTEEERRGFYGTLLAFFVVVPGLLLAFLELGGHRLLQLVLPDVPYHPFVALALWTTYVMVVFTDSTQDILRARQRAGPYTAVNIGLFVGSTLFTIWLVVGRGWGAEGVLLGRLLGTVPVAAVAGWWLLRYIRWEFHPGLLRRALIYSAPLAPHFLAHWVLNASDRLMLQPFVSLDEIGIYNVGYVLGSVIGILALGGHNGLLPSFGQLDRDNEADVRHTMTLSTYYMLAIVAVGLAMALFAVELVALVTPDAYASAGMIIPWVVLGFTAMAAYYPAANSLTMVVGETGTIAMATIFSAGANIVLNLLLIPPFGITGAAIATAAAYGLLALIVHGISRRRARLPFEYRRLFHMLVTGALLFLLGWLAAPASLALAVGFKVLVLAAFPAILLLTGFFSPDERARMRRIMNRE